MADSGSLADAIRASADRLGISPYDLATAISYETGGRLSPSITGGAGGKYLGLIQFSPENQKRYGVRADQTAPEQMGAVESYLRDRGVKPGMGLLDVYSTINAGRPGLYNASDANNGGAPGTVADKVNTMGAHALKARMLLDGKLPDSMMAPPGGGAPAAAPSAPAAVASGDVAPFGFGAAPQGDDPAAGLIGAAAKIAQEAQAEPGPQFRPIDFNLTMPPAKLAQMRRLMAQMRG